MSDRPPGELAHRLQARVHGFVEIDRLVGVVGGFSQQIHELGLLFQLLLGSLAFGSVFIDIFMPGSQDSYSLRRKDPLAQMAWQEFVRRRVFWRYLKSPSGRRLHRLKWQ